MNEPMVITVPMAKLNISLTFTPPENLPKNEEKQTETDSKENNITNNITNKEIQNG